MVEFKLKSLYLKQKKTDPLKVKETTTQDLVILRIGDYNHGKSKYHHFHVPLHAIVEIQYETPDHNNLLRIVFQLNQRNLAIQYYTWNETEQHYIEAALENEIIHSLPFQAILQSISFSSDNHLSYIVNSLQPLTDIQN